MLRFSLFRGPSAWMAATLLLLSIATASAVEETDSQIKLALEKAGENSEVARLYKFTHPKQVTDNTDEIKSFIFEALEVERIDLKDRCGEPDQDGKKPDHHDQLKQAGAFSTPKVYKSKQHGKSNGQGHDLEAGQEQLDIGAHSDQGKSGFQGQRQPGA